MTLIAVALACAVPQRPLVENERPNIVLVLMEGEVPPTPIGVVALPLYAVVERTGDPNGALLTGQWLPSPQSNSIAGVLSLYGYRTATTAAAESVRALGFLETAGEGWVEAGPEPFFMTDGGSDAAGMLARWQTTLYRAGLRPRTAVVFAWTDGWNHPGALWWDGPRAPELLSPGEMASTVDVLPTLLAVARATIPTDAGGVDLGRPGAGSQAAYGIAADGAFVIRSDRHRLIVRTADPLPEACPADAVLSDADGSLVDETAARDALYVALRAWRARQTAKSARDRLGADHFDRLNAAQGYWR